MLFGLIETLRPLVALYEDALANRRSLNIQQTLALNSRFTFDSTILEISETEQSRERRISKTTDDISFDSNYAKRAVLRGALTPKRRVSRTTDDIPISKANSVPRFVMRGSKFSSMHRQTFLNEYDRERPEPTTASTYTPSPSPKIAPLSLSRHLSSPSLIVPKLSGTSTSLKDPVDYSPTDHHATSSPSISPSKQPQESNKSAAELVATSGVHLLFYFPF